MRGGLDPAPRHSARSCGDIRAERGDDRGMTQLTSLSDSSVQRKAEAPILLAAASALGCGPLLGQRVPIADGVHVQVDGVDDGELVFVEVYARQGPLKGAQFHKVARDVLKLVRVREHHGSKVRTVIVFASSAARDSVRGWLQQAAADSGVELLAVEIDDGLRDQIRAAQERQVMVNLPVGDLADDVDAIEQD